MQIRGRAWIFGDNINTDLIVPGQYLELPVEDAAKHAFEANDPSFAKDVKHGDIIVAGRNFGCGSSRESAPQVIKYLGISCILAESFARIFFRNSIAIGLPVLMMKNHEGKIKQLNEISIYLDTGEAVHNPSGEKFQTSKLHKNMWDIIESGGIDGLLKKLAMNREKA